jgi:asparagine synthase (glutamine-hydrolysing)
LLAASTLAPFFAFPAFPKKLDPEGLRDYLAFQTPLAPHTLVKDIHALPPGACLKWKVGAGGTARQWWTIPDPDEAIPDRASLIDETDALLGQAVKDQLVADVPLGAFLSGGIDSSLMVHYMAQAGATPLKTFSVRFAEAAFDESHAAKAVAQQYGTEHHVLDAPDLTADLLISALADLDQPLADPAYIPTWALARLTREHVTVAISGDGGDELFGGYPRFLDTADHYPDSAGKRLLRTLLKYGLAPASLTRRSLAGRELLLYRRVELGNYPGSRKDLRRYLSPEIAAAARPDDTLLRQGLEVRVPLLANSLQDRMLKLPAEVHFDKYGGKSILRALARRHLPEAVWGRPKHGFSVPLRNNFSGPWRDWLEAQVAQAETRAHWLNSGAIATLAKETLDGHGNLRLLYALLVLLNWLESHPLEYVES